MPSKKKLAKIDRVLDHTLKDRVSNSPRASWRYLADDMAVMARFNDIVPGWTTAVRKVLPLASEERW